MNIGEISTLFAAVLSGGFITEVFRAWRNRKQDELDLFVPLWKHEMARLRQELEDCRFRAVRLADACLEAGLDPVSIVYGDAARSEEPPSQ